MRTLYIGNKNTKQLEVPAVGAGCMRITSLETEKTVRKFVDSAIDIGINFFDHADIYANGDAERLFGNAMHGEKRDKMILQSKCAIRPNVCYDFSKKYILDSVDGILRRLQTDYLDILLLHRPDTLMDGEEVSEAFDILARSGKVRYFGVSNQNSMQVDLMNKNCGNRVVIDQLQLSIPHCDIIDSGFNVNVHSDVGCNRDGSILEYCRINGIRIQAWSPFQYGTFEGCFIGNEKFTKLNEVLERIAEKYSTTPNGIAVAWILRHPAGIQTIVGTTNQQRLNDIGKAADIFITREEWYELYLAAGKKLP